VHLFDGRVAEEDATHAHVKDLEDAGFHMGGN
jgi:hypothetical protein